MKASLSLLLAILAILVFAHPSAVRGGDSVIFLKEAMAKIVPVAKPMVPPETIRQVQNEVHELISQARSDLPYKMRESSVSTTLRLASMETPKIPQAPRTVVSKRTTASQRPADKPWDMRKVYGLLGEAVRQLEESPAK